MNPSTLEKVINSINSPFLTSFKKYSDSQFDFILQKDSHSWNIRLYFNTGFPNKLPKVELLDKHLIGKVPHVNLEGTICLGESDSVIIDYTRPKDVIQYVLEKIVTLLKKGQLKIYRDELTDEYEGYFQASMTTPSVNSFYLADNVTEHVYLRVTYPTKNNKKNYAFPVLLFSKKGGLPNQFSNIEESSKIQTIKAIHFPISQAILPPENQQTITSAYIFDALKYLSDENKKKLNKLLEKDKGGRQFFVLFSLPRTYGERSQILLDFRSKKTVPHPLSKLSENWEVISYLVTRNNKSYLLERGGATLNLSNKKVSIIGCGSVGSEIAFMLAKSGIGKLTLVDHDMLEVDNIYRHRLGGMFLNYAPNQGTGIVGKFHKVDAIASALKTELPYIDIKSKPVQFEKILEDRDFLTSDVVISAVGSPLINLEINKQLKKRGLRKAIFCWNEAASLGGHSVSLDLSKNCYECLFTDSEGFRLNCELQLLKPGEKVTKNLTGCAGVFTPFSYLDSAQTATLATQQCIDSLLHNSTSYALSWKGENKHTLKVTSRYKNMNIKEKINLSRKEKCHICHEL